MNAEAILALCQELKLAGLATQFPPHDRPYTFEVVDLKYAGKFGILSNSMGNDPVEYATLITPIYLRDGVQCVDVYYGTMEDRGTTFKANSTGTALLVTFYPSPAEWKSMERFFVSGESEQKGVSIPMRKPHKSVFAKAVEAAAVKKTPEEREYDFFATSRHSIATLTGLDRTILKYVHMHRSKRIETFISTMVPLVSNNVLRFGECGSDTTWSITFNPPFGAPIYGGKTMNDPLWLTDSPELLGKPEWIAKSKSQRGTVEIRGKQQNVDLSQ